MKSRAAHLNARQYVEQLAAAGRYAPPSHHVNPIYKPRRHQTMSMTKEQIETIAQLRHDGYVKAIAEEVAA